MSFEPATIRTEAGIKSRAELKTQDRDRKRFPCNLFLPTLLKSIEPEDADKEDLVQSCSV